MVDEFPFLCVTTYLSSAHQELVPTALQRLFTRKKRYSLADARAAVRLLGRIQGWDVDDELRAWLRAKASLHSYRALHMAFEATERSLRRSSASDASARGVAAELLACQTLLNAARLALRVFLGL